MLTSDKKQHWMRVVILLAPLDISPRVSLSSHANHLSASAAVPCHVRITVPGKKMARTCHMSLRSIEPNSQTSQDESSFSLAGLSTPNPHTEQLDIEELMLLLPDQQLAKPHCNMMQKLQSF